MSKKTINKIIPKLAKFISQGTDAGNMVFLLENAGFDISLELYSESQKSKQDFLHEVFLQYTKKGEMKPFSNLSELLTVNDYFRPGEYDYTYDEEEAKNLSKELKNCIKSAKTDRPSNPKEFRKLLFDIIGFHKGLHVISKDLFVDEHYEQSVSEACKFLENYIQDKINDRSKIGVELMSYVFKKDNPVLSLYSALNDEKKKNEQEGFHLLTLGEVKYIKNRLSHRKSGTVVKGMSNAFKILGFISFLLEEVDKMTIIESEEDLPF